MSGFGHDEPAKADPYCCQNHHQYRYCVLQIHQAAGTGPRNTPETAGRDETEKVTRYDHDRTARTAQPRTRNRKHAPQRTTAGHIGKGQHADTTGQQEAAELQEEPSRKVKGGLAFLLVNKLWGLLAGLTLFFAVMVFLIGPSSTASFGKTAVGALGTGFGVTVGSIPHFIDSMKDGQKAVSGDSKKDKEGK